MAANPILPRSVVVLGPQGCGKTRNTNRIAGYFKLDQVFDDLNPLGGTPLVDRGVLYFVSAPYDDLPIVEEQLVGRTHVRLSVLRYDSVMAAIQASTPVAKDTNPKEAVGDKKVAFFLTSGIAAAHWAAAQIAGYCKYGAWNWRIAGVRASTYISAIPRHLHRWTNGERLDPVDGTHHLGNIMACCAILLEAEAIGKLNDDRPPAATEALLKVFDEVEAITARLREQYKDRNPKHYTIADEIKP